MTGFTGYIQLVYVLAAAMFVVGLHLMNSPATARRGNQVAMPGMVIAVVATFVLLIHYGHGHRDRLDRADRRRADRLRGRPVGGADGPDDGDAAAGVGVQRGRRRRRRAGGDLRLLRGRVHAGGVLGTTSVFTVLDVLIGSVTFSGSIIAAGKLQGFIPRPADHLQGRPPAQPGPGRRRRRHGRVHAHHRQPARAAHRGAGLAGVRGDDGAADRRRGHAGGHLAAERVHRHRGGDGRLRHRELGADRGGRAGGRVRKHPDQADGRRDEPVAGQHHRGRVRHRGQRGRGRRRPWTPRSAPSRPTTRPSSSPTRPR